MQKESLPRNPGLWLGVNGFGRIGRLLVRQSLSSTECVVVAVNDPHMTTDQMAYALQHDTTHGRLAGEVYVSNDKKTLHIKLESPDSLLHTIACYHLESPAEIPWSSTGVDFVVECSGKLLTSMAAKTHLRSTRKVLMSHPPSDDTPVFIPRINTEKYIPQTPIISCASCTTNALAPLLLVIDRVFGVEECLFTTVHAVTASQKVVDTSGQKGCMDNIIPTSTGAAQCATRVLPALADKITGLALRVPVTDVSVIDVTVRLTNPCSGPEFLGAAIAGAAQNELSGILGLCGSKRTASSDFKTDSRSCVVDLESCIFLNDRFVKIVAYYDNEWAYAARLLELCVLVENIDSSEGAPSGGYLLTAK